MTDDARRRAEELVSAWKQRVFPGALLEPPDHWLIGMMADAVAQAVKEERERLRAWPHQCVMEACCIEQGLADGR